MSCNWLCMYTVSQKNDTDVEHKNFNCILTDFGNFFAEMLLSEYSIEW